MIITEETTLEIVETIEIPENIAEGLVLAPENKGISYSLTLVCVHNLGNVTFPLLVSPSILTVSTENISPTLDISLTEA